MKKQTRQPSINSSIFGNYLPVGAALFLMITISLLTPAVINADENEEPRSSSEILENLKDNLDLTSDQIDKITPLIEKFTSDRNEINQKYSGDNKTDQVIREIKRLRRQRNLKDKLWSIITVEQMEKFNRMHFGRMEKLQRMRLEKREELQRMRPEKTEKLQRRHRDYNRRHREDPRRHKIDRIDYLWDRLELTDKQAKEVIPIILDNAAERREKIEAMCRHRRDLRSRRVPRKPGRYFYEKNEETTKKLESILSEEQMEKFEEILRESRESRAEGRFGRHNPPFYARKYRR